MNEKRFYHETKSVFHHFKRPSVEVEKKRDFFGR